jgi:hypothetical protein
MVSMSAAGLRKGNGSTVKAVRLRNTVFLADVTRTEQIEWFSCLSCSAFLPFWLQSFACLMEQFLFGGESEKVSRRKIETHLNYTNCRNKHRNRLCSHEWIASPPAAMIWPYEKTTHVIMLVFLKIWSVINDYNSSQCNRQLRGRMQCRSMSYRCSIQVETDHA